MRLRTFLGVGALYGCEWVGCGMLDIAVQQLASM